jgi:hypothetical protein
VPARQGTARHGEGNTTYRRQKMTRVWDPETSPAKAAEAFVGQVEAETDAYDRMLLDVSADILGRGLVFVQLDGNTDEDNAIIEADFAAKGQSDYQGGFFLELPFDADVARNLAALLTAAADKADADREDANV